MNRPRSLVLLSALAAALVSCQTDEAFQAIRNDLAQVRGQIAALTMRGEELHAQGATQGHAIAALANRVKKTEGEEADLSARLAEVGGEVRGLRGQEEDHDRRLERMGTQLKDAGDRLSRVEFTSAQAAMMAQQAASTAQLTAQSAQSALQNMAEQVNTALSSASIGHSATRRSPDPPAPAIPTTPRAPDPPRNGTAAPASIQEASTPPSATPLPAGRVPEERPVPGGLRTITPRGRTSSSPTVIDLETTYRLSLTAFTEGRYLEAIDGFDSLLQADPARAASLPTYYWLGEAHYAQQHFTEAADAFQRFLTASPRSPKRPAALLKVGLIAQATGQAIEAQQTFKTLIASHPGSHEASVARTLLEEKGATVR